MYFWGTPCAVHHHPPRRVTDTALTRHLARSRQHRSHEWEWPDARSLPDFCGILHRGAVLTARPEDVPQHGRASTKRILRQHDLPPGDQGFHGPGGRPDRYGARGGVELRGQVRGRDQARPEAHRGGRGIHGELGAQHQRFTVLCYLGPHAVAGREAHHSGSGIVGDEGGATDGNGGGELGRQAPAGHADSPREAARARAGGGRATRRPMRFTRPALSWGSWHVRYRRAGRPSDTACMRKVGKPKC